MVTEAIAPTQSTLGIERRDDLLIVRHRWQGLLGPNGWFTVPLVAAAGFLIVEGLRRDGCVATTQRTVVLDPRDPSSGFTSEVCERWGRTWRPWDELNTDALLGAVGCLAVAGLLALCFYPAAEFGVERIRWRNRFLWKEMPTAKVRTMSVTNFKWPRWQPTITLMRVSSWRPRKLASTFSFRAKRAVLVADAVREFCEAHSIHADLDPSRMRWQWSEPPGVRQGHSVPTH